MQQQSEIVLNFEEIFASTKDLRGNPSLQADKYDEPSPELHHSLSEPTSIPLLSQTLAHNYTATSLTSQTANRHKRLYNASVLPSAAERIRDINSLLAKGSISRRKMSTSADISIIVNRLSENQHKFRHIQLNKTTQVSEEGQKLDANKIKNSHKFPSKNTQAVPSHEQRKFSQKEKDLTVFQRLHFDSRFYHRGKKQQVKGQGSITRSNKKQANKSQKSKYLQSYIPFYERLQSQVNRTQQKIKMIQNGCFQGLQANRNPFQPKLYPNKYAKKVKSRYLSASRQIKHSLQIRNNSMDSSECGSLDKSREMTASVEQHFFKKMRCVFIDQNSEYIEITQKTVSLLTDLQFQMLQGFIRRLDQNPIPARQFEQSLFSYYQGLSTAQKIRLRSHQTRIKHKYSLLRAKDGKESSSRKADEPLCKANFIAKKNSKYNGNYHVLLQHFI